MLKTMWIIIIAAGGFTSLLIILILIIIARVRVRRRHGFVKGDFEEEKDSVVHPYTKTCSRKSNICVFV